MTEQIGQSEDRKYVEAKIDKDKYKLNEAMDRLSNLTSPKDFKRTEQFKYGSEVVEEFQYHNITIKTRYDQVRLDEFTPARLKNHFLALLGLGKILKPEELCRVTNLSLIRDEKK